jgi:hypothetical protein
VAKPARGLKAGGGVKGEGTGGVHFQTKINTFDAYIYAYKLRKNFQITDARIGEFWRIFQTKISALTPVFMPVDFGKVPNPFDF